MRVIKIIFKVALYVAAGVGGLIAVLLLSIWVDHGRETTLRSPTGQLAVGCTTAVWSDPATADSMAPVAGAKRELFAWIWYPATPPPAAQPAGAYMPAALREAMKGGFVITLLNRDSSRIRAHSYADAAVSAAQQTYPVVLMRPGLAALTIDYTSLAENLASHGYVVVGIDAPYRSFAVAFPDGRVIRRAPQNNADLVGGQSRNGWPPGWRRRGPPT